MQEEHALVLRARKGDTEALTELLSHNYAFVLKYLIKVTMNAQTAEDLAQETMLKALEKIVMFDGRSKFSSWLISIATRLYLDTLRKKRREREWSEAEVQAQAARTLRWKHTAQGGEWSDALDALSRLRDEQRLPIVLKHYYGYSQEEIAGMLGIPEGTVKSRIHNGLHTLRKELMGDGPR